MNKWGRDITAEDFKKWLLEDFIPSADIYDWVDLFEKLEPTILELEQEDYFGTEGFDGRFG